MILCTFLLWLRYDKKIVSLLKLLPFHVEIIKSAIFPANTKHLYNICTMLAQRWANIVQMLYKCFVFTKLSVSPSHILFVSLVERGVIVGAGVSYEHCQLYRHQPLSQSEKINLLLKAIKLIIIKHCFFETIAFWSVNRFNSGMSCHIYRLYYNIQMSIDIIFFFPWVFCSNPFAAKWFKYNFHPLEVLGRGSEPQLQVGENY